MSASGGGCTASHAGKATVGDGLIVADIGERRPIERIQSGWLPLVDTDGGFSVPRAFDDMAHPDRGTAKVLLQGTQPGQERLGRFLQRPLGRRGGWALGRGFGLLLLLTAECLLSCFKAANVTDGLETHGLESVQGDGRAAARAAVQGYVVGLGDSGTTRELLNVLVLDVDGAIQEAGLELGRRADINEQ